MQIFKETSIGDASIQPRQNCGAQVAADPSADHGAAVRLIIHLSHLCPRKGVQDGCLCIVNLESQKLRSSGLGMLQIYVRGILGVWIR